MKQLDRCVYFHLTPDTGEVFYIGVGTARRAKNFKERNRFWHRKVVKHGFPKVLIIADGLTSEKAVEIEKFWIKFYTLEKLTNISPGGDGINGFEHSIETIEKIRISSTGRKHSEISKLKMSNIRKGVKISQDNINKIIAANTGRTPTDETRKKLSNSHKSKTIYNFFHSFYGKIYCTQSHLRETYNLNGNNLSEMINGKRKSHKGWVVIHPPIVQESPRLNELDNDT